MNGAVLMTCLALFALDGDNINCDGVNLRDMGDGTPFESGYDTPEMYGFLPKCDSERELGIKARARLTELLSTPDLQIWDSGEVDEFGRPLVWVRMPAGTSVASIMIEEGLARPTTPGYEPNWCAE